MYPGLAELALRRTGALRVSRHLGGLNIRRTTTAPGVGVTHVDSWKMPLRQSGLLSRLGA